MAAGLAFLGFALAGCKSDLAPLQQEAKAPAVAPTAIHAPAPAAPTVPDTVAAKRAAPAGPTVALADLPAPGPAVYRAIFNGGPFAFDKDGAIFGNRERLLPRQPRGYYREYTVAQPRARNRGARRIVCGGTKNQPEVCYYTADHYASFQTIVP
ncbi:MAG: ribonuclease domain-containing protein [Brachymonas sp.]|nr:ribonuclease domain-containing protein [Brachymonas sp.]